MVTLLTKLNHLHIWVLVCWMQFRHWQLPPWRHNIVIIFGIKKIPCWHSVMAVCYGLFFKEQPHPCFLINTATLQFVTATVFSVNSKIAGTLGRIGMQSGLPGYLVEQIFFLFLFSKKHCVGNLISGCRLVGQRLLPGWKFPFLSGSSQDRCVSLSSAILMSVHYAALRSLNSGGLAATIWSLQSPACFRRWWGDSYLTRSSTGSVCRQVR